MVGSIKRLFLPVALSNFFTQRLRKQNKIYILEQWFVDHRRTGDLRLESKRIRPCGKAMIYHPVAVMAKQFKCFYLF